MSFNNLENKKARLINFLQAGVLPLVFMTGCATINLYDSTKTLQISSITEQVSWYLIFYEGVDILNIDGWKISDTFAYKFKLSPEKHSMNAKVNINLFPVIAVEYFCEQLEFELEPNGDYKVQSNGYFIEITNMKTNRVLDRKFCIARGNVFFSLPSLNL